MFLRIILFFILFHSANAQVDVKMLIDSLAQTTKESEKASLSMNIASELVNQDWKRALHYIDIAEKSARHSNSDSIIANFYIEVAFIYARKEAYDITLANLLEAYKYYENKPFKERYVLENDLAIAYSQTENYDQALKFFQKITNHEYTSEDPIRLAKMYNNIGLVWMEKNLDSAMAYYDKSVALIKDEDMPDFKVLLYTNLGRAYALKDDSRNAKRYFNLAVHERGNIRDGRLAWVYGDFSEFLLKNKKLDSAIYYSKDAVRILDSIAPFSIKQLKASKVLYKAYIENKEFEKAANYFEKFTAISDSLNIEDRRINVQKIVLEEEYRTKDKIRKLEESKSRSNMYSVIFGLFALLLILAVLLYIYRTKLKRIELEKQLVTSKQKELHANLELKNKELIGKAMIELHHTEIIEDILKDLKEVKLKAHKKETQNAIDYIAKRLKRDTNTNIWDEFELRFKEVHESFYKNLLKTHPDLTSKDKRLCALLMLNLTTKEIAQITGQSSKSVENARTRLRKKLDITNSQADLSSYLSNLG